MRGDRVAAERLEVVERRREPDRALDVRRAGLERVRRRRVLGLLEGDGADHARRRPGRAASPRAARAAPRARRCRSGRRPCGRRRRRSRSPAPATSTGRCGAACAPSTRTSAPRACARSTISAHRVDGAEGVRDVGDGDEPRARREQPLELLEHAARRGRRSAPRRRRAPRSSHSICQGTMLEWCSSSVISTSSPAPTLRPAPARRHQVDRLGGAAHEDDLARRRRRRGSGATVSRASS